MPLFGISVIASMSEIRIFSCPPKILLKLKSLEKSTGLFCEDGVLLRCILD